MHTFCPLSGEWPWGVQNCTVGFGSWVYDETDLDLYAEPWSKADVISMNWMEDKRVRFSWELILPICNMKYECVLPLSFFIF